MSEVLNFLAGLFTISHDLGKFSDMHRTLSRSYVQNVHKSNKDTRIGYKCKRILLKSWIGVCSIDVPCQSSTILDRKYEVGIHPRIIVWFALT